METGKYRLLAHLREAHGFEPLGWFVSKAKLQRTHGQMQGLRRCGWRL